MIPVPNFVAPSVALPSAVSTVQHMPANSVVNNYPPTVLTSPTFPLPIASPYFCLPPPIHFPVHQDVGAEAGSVLVPACRGIVPGHCSVQEGARLVQDNQVSREEQVQETSMSESLHQQQTRERTDERWSFSESLNDVSYRDKILDDDISRERLKKRMMKEKIEQWKIRDGLDSDRVEFERLRTPHRNIIDAGMFFTIVVFIIL